MTEPNEALIEEVERLRALYVWPQSVADHHADTLSPRQIKQLYAVGNVADEAATLIEQQAATILDLRERLAKARIEARKELIAQGCIHTAKAKQSTERADLEAWQAAQSEWFDPVILEIVGEYAAWRDTQEDKPNAR